MKALTTLLALTLLSGCAWLKTEPKPPEITIITEKVPVEIFQPPMPNPVLLRDVYWFVITEENLEEKLEQIRIIQDADAVVFGITPADYENMTWNIQELRRYIRQQKELIIYYRGATKPSDTNTDTQPD